MRVTRRACVKPRGMVALGVVLFALASMPAVAQASACGHVVYHYRIDGTGFNAILAGLDYHGGISASGLRCTDARSFVTSYTREGFNGALSRNDFNPPGFLSGFRCHRTRDGDDSGRNYCVRRRARVFFSDSDGQFASAQLPRLIAGSWSGIKPADIYFSGGAGNIVTRITWSRWTRTSSSWFRYERRPRLHPQLRRRESDAGGYAHHPL